jgi:putative ABC transport system substrate-binding protein
MQSYFAREGGLLFSGVNQVELFRRAASYVDRILKGEKPADLPVQRPTKYELVINLKTAKTLGLIVPPNLLRIRLARDHKRLARDHKDERAAAKGW